MFPPKQLQNMIFPQPGGPEPYEEATGEQSQSWFSKAASIPAVLIVTVAFHGLAVLLSKKVSLFPGADALMTIISTCAQIIAGLYGITMASYTFFLSRIDALVAQDTTLDYIVSSLKNRFKKLIWYITFNVVFVLFITVFLMYCPIPSNEDHAFFYRLFCNEFVLSLGFSIISILYYSILVIDPNALEKEAKKIKKRISHSPLPSGNVAEYITLYDRIETRCNALVPQNVLDQLHENKGKHFEFTIELLKVQHPALLPLIPDLNRVHRYYECVVNCKPMTVTKEMCSLARRVLTYLEQVSDKLPR